VHAVLPYLHPAVWWFASRSVPRDKIVSLANPLKLKIWLKEFALSLGVPEAAVTRTKMGFRSEASEKVLARMKKDLSSLDPSSAAGHSEIFASWSWNMWKGSLKSS